MYSAALKLIRLLRSKQSRMSINLNKHWRTIRPIGFDLNKQKLFDHQFIVIANKKRMHQFNWVDFSTRKLCTSRWVVDIYKWISFIVFECKQLTLLVYDCSTSKSRTHAMIISNTCGWVVMRIVNTKKFNKIVNCHVIFATCLVIRLILCRMMFNYNLKICWYFNYHQLKRMSILVSFGVSSLLAVKSPIGSIVFYRIVDYQIRQINFSYQSQWK